ncbi:RxLR effector protein [Phytophthora megakarya]|uniref:RxLR effector protein n=1 Tax=Phytophthora megakarya TaxID=4795 RepID=A0A225VQX0_9STRA|nr:RxLR effector protein [Phytophthora megakarya]
MWNDIHKRVPTTDYWLAMEEKLKKQIKTVQDLDGIKNTNEFRIFKRYAHLFDSSIVGHMHSGYYNPTHFGNDFTKATNMMEWRARAEIWGEYKIHPADVKMWMADAKTWLSKANTDEIYRVYEPIYSKAPRQPSLPEAQAADKEVLRKFMLDPLMKDKPLTDFHLADFSS